MAGYESASGERGGHQRTETEPLCPGPVTEIDMVGVVDGVENDERAFATSLWTAVRMVPNSISIGICNLDADELATGAGAVDDGTVATDTIRVAVMTLSETLDDTEDMSTVMRWGQRLSSRGGGSAWVSGGQLFEKEEES